MLTSPILALAKLKNSMHHESSRSFEKGQTHKRQSFEYQQSNVLLLKLGLLFFLLSPEGWHGTLPSHWFSLGLKSEALWVGGGKTDIGSTWEWKIEF